MANENISWWNKYRKDVVKAVLLVAMVVFAVLGYHFSDAANTAFWWNLWYWLAIACGLGWVVGWAIFWSKDKKR